jgi:multidrug efflux pump subunit AcrA (membrane-fusion protein)
MVVSIDPIHVYFNVDEPTFVRVVRTMRGESEPAMVDRRQFVVDIGLVDDRERRYPYRCVVDFLNNQVDPQTATITVRGVLENPHDPDPAHPRPPLFRSGMFIRARLPLGKPADLTLVPEAAIGSNQDRKLLWLVDADGTVHSRDVVPGQKVGAWVAVRSADPARPLDASDRVVVRGLQRCREGKPVTVVVAPAEIIGLDTLPAASAAALAPLPQASPASGVPTAPAEGAVETLPRPAGVTVSPEPSGPTPP